jgi:hypothetical protein
MRKYLFLLLCLSTSYALAQDVNSDYQSFRKNLLTDYQGFRKSVLEDYAQYLQGVWDQYDEFRGKKRDDHPKPSTSPITEDKPNIPQSLPIPKIVPQEQPAEPSTTPKQPEPIRPTIPTDPLSTIDLDFYGMTLQVYPYKVASLKKMEHNEIARAWEKYGNDNNLKSVVNNLQAIASACGFNDWFTFELVRVYSKKVVAEELSRVLLQHFLLVNMGYNVRLASTDTQLLLLVPFKQQVYERNYLVIDGLKYYAFYDDNAINDQRKGIYTCRLPQDADQGRFLDLTFHGGNFGIRTEIKHSFALSDGTISLHGTVDKGTMESIRHYPQMDIPYYAMSCINADLHRALLNQVSAQIQGQSEKEAVGKILHFVQYAFKYATDEEQHGFEKPYFIEENFYYPKNDCEDRAILFAFLVHNILGLDVHLVHYPGHECTAVNFAHSSVYGDSYIMNGKSYYICDPTYIGAPIGLCMPDYKKVKPIVEQWY